MSDEQSTSGDVALILFFAYLDAKLKRTRRRNAAILLKDMTELLEAWEHVTPVKSPAVTTAAVKCADSVWRKRLPVTMKAVR